MQDREWLRLFLIALSAILLALFLPDCVFAIGGLESKMERLRDSLTGTLLPLASAIGLTYAAILAIFGSGEGKGRVIAVIAMSVVGFLAKHIIEFFQGIAG